MKLSTKLGMWFAGKQFKWFRSGNERLISINVAKKIQQSAYEHSLAHHEEAYSPTYLQIVPDLDDKNDQVFQSAMFYLGKIAENHQEYRDPIIMLMNNRISSTRLSDNRKQLLKNKIEFLQNL